MASQFGDTVVPAQYQATVLTAASAYGVPPALLAAQIDAESSFNKGSVSPDGAIGISQFLPSTAKSLGIDPHDPVASINAQAKLMAYYFKKYGSWEKALYAYHGGPGIVDSPGAKSIAYAKKILGIAGGDLVDPNPNAVPIPNAGSLTGLADPFNKLENFLKAFSDPGKWQRAGFYLLGVMLVGFGVWILAKPVVQGEVEKMVG
jgi:membrane-bound lytic murein transglycosylase B